MIDMAQKTMNTEWCSMKTPITRLTYGNHSGRGFVETGEMRVGDKDVRHSKHTGADYEIKLLEIGQGADETPTARVEITRTNPYSEAKETRNAELVDWTAPRTYAEVLKDQKEGLEAGVAPLSGNASEPHKVVAIPFEGNGTYLVVAYASISVPGKLGKMVGKVPTAKLYVSEGRLDAPLNYSLMK